MPYKLIYLEKALQDLESILDYIAKDSPARASEYIKYLQKEIGGLSQLPKLGVDCKRKHIRRECKILIVDSYLVFYRIDETEQVITIGRVLRDKVNYKQKKLF